MPSKGQVVPMLPDVACWQIMYTAATRCRVGASAMRMLAVMLRHASLEEWRENARLLSWPSYAEFKREARLPHGSITHARQELIAAGLIQRAPGHQRGGDDPTACYCINPRVKDPIAAAAAAALIRKRRQRDLDYARARREAVLDTLNGHVVRGLLPKP
jgi:hypothetical protein